MIYGTPRRTSDAIREKMKIFEPHHDDWVGSNSSLETKSEMISSNSRRITEEGLIMPKKLVNPCLESSDRQSLHRELLFNQKIGKTVLNQKTELERALEKQKERRVIAAQNEMNKDCPSMTGELGKVIMERALKKTPKDDQNNTCSEESSEFLNEEYLKARQRLRASKYT